LSRKKLAYADRAKYYTDPKFAKVPVNELISKEYAKERAKLFDPNKARTEVPAGDAKARPKRTPFTSASSIKDRKLRVADSEQTTSASVSGLGFRGPRVRDSKPRARCFALDENPREQTRTGQAAVPHDHPGDGHEGRQNRTSRSA